MSSASVTPIPLSRPSPTPLRRIVASAPMRVSFAGGGTDLPRVAGHAGGRVIGSAVGIRTVAVVEPFDPGWVRLAAPGGDALRRSGEPARDDLALRLLEAALAATGVSDGVSLRIETEVEPGAGLGGSAAAAVAALLALRASRDEPPAPGELVQGATIVERSRLGIEGGDQDPIFAAHGGVLDLSFDARGCSGIRALTDAGAPLSSLLAALEAGLLLVDTGVRRVSGEVIRRREPPGPDLIGALLAAADQVARGFAEGSLEQVLAGMRESAAAKAAAAPAASAVAGEIAERIRGRGAEVVRVCGAGGGGHVMVWAPPELHAALLEALGGWKVRRPALNAAGARIEGG